MTYCTEQQRHTDTHMHTHAHMWNHTTHTHTDTREPRLMVLAQVKHHRGWWNVKQQGEEASYSVFLIMQRGVTLQHCISRYDTSWLVNPRSYWRNTHTRGGEGKGGEKVMHLVWDDEHSKQRETASEKQIMGRANKRLRTDGKHTVV